jgi:hypothetical protein
MNPRKFTETLARAVLDQLVRLLEGEAGREMDVSEVKIELSSVCVECLIGKQRNQFSLRSPSRVPYRTELIPRAPKGRRTRTPHP